MNFERLGIPSSKFLLVSETFLRIGSELSIRRHILSSRRGGPFVLVRNGFVSFAMLPSALLMSLLFGDSVHCEIHLFGQSKALQSSHRSLLPEGGPSSQSRSRLMLDPKRSDTEEAVHLALGPLRQDHHLLLFFSFDAWVLLLL
jgi:hypothetical protein